MFNDVTLEFVIVTGHFKSKKKQINETVVAVKSFVIGAEGVRFDYQVDQTGHNVANERPTLRHFLEAVLSRR